MCHTQEIAFEPAHDEWRPVDEWSEDVTQSQNCEPPETCRLCCRPGDSYVEEVLVVHHEALQKVDFLLRHDELTSCESPAVPECVTAVRRAKVLKRLLSQQRSNGQPAGLEDSGAARALAVSGPPQPCQDEDEDADPSDEDVCEDSNMLPGGDFVTDRSQSGLEQRLHDGLDMWTLSRGRDKEILQEAVVVQHLPEIAVLRVTGGQIRVDFPLANLTCVELTSTLENDGGHCAGVPEESGVREDRGVYVYLTATKRDQKAGEGAFHFAFQHSQDAQDFRTWMRTFYPSQVVSASDTDNVV